MGRTTTAASAASAMGGLAPSRDRHSWATTTAPRFLNKTNAKNEGGTFSYCPSPRQPRSPSPLAHRHQQQQQRHHHQHYHLRPFVGVSREGVSSPTSTVAAAAAVRGTLGGRGATTSATTVISATSTVTTATTSSAAQRTAAAAAVARLGYDTRRTARGVHAGYTMGKQSRSQQSSRVTRGVHHRAGGGRNNAPGASCGATTTKTTAGRTAGNTAGTSAGGTAAGTTVGGAGMKQQSSRRPLLRGSRLPSAAVGRGFDTKLQGAGGWSPAPAKFNEHPLMITPRTFRVPVLGVSIKLSVMEVRCAPPPASADARQIPIQIRMQTLAAVV